MQSNFEFINITKVIGLSSASSSLSRLRSEAPNAPVFRFPVIVGSCLNPVHPKLFLGIHAAIDLVQYRDNLGLAKSGPLDCFSVQVFNVELSMTMGEPTILIS